MRFFQGLDRSQTKTPIVLTRVVATLLAAGAVLFAPAPAHAEVTFSNIADTTMSAPGQTAFTSFNAPSISGSNVAFRAAYNFLNRPLPGIYTGTVGVTGASTLYNPGNPGAISYDFSNPTISGSNVAFSGFDSTLTYIYSGTAGTTGATVVVEKYDTAAGRDSWYIGLGPASVSGDNVVFSASLGLRSCIDSAKVGIRGATKMVDGSDTGHDLTTPHTPSISGNNVAFQASSTGGSGIYSAAVGSLGASKIVETGDAAPGHGTFSGFSLNTSISGSTIAFVGSFSGGSGIYTGTVATSGSAKVVDTDDTAPGHGLFTEFGNAPSISGNNVAFVGNYSGGSGLYVEIGGAGGSLMPILNTGDTLFGNTVTSLALDHSGFDNDKIGFLYGLADGRSGIAVVTLPEPASLGLVLTIGCWKLLRRRPSRK